MIYIILFLIGFALGHYTPKIMRYTKRDDVKNHIDHMPPKYYAYHGGYWQTNKCSGCGLIGMYEDLNTANVCPRCGCQVKSGKSAKWQEKDGLMQWDLSIK